MSATQHHHETLKNLLAQGRLEQAQSLWFELAEQLPAQSEFLLLLAKEFADAGHAGPAGELASLLAPNLKADSKHHEWLYALKLQAVANPTDKPLRAEITAAYHAIYQTDPRLKTILAVAGLDQNQAPLPAALAKADTLLALATGAYCQHKSWGVGRVKNFDTTLGRLAVAFPHNPDHAFQLAYAAESLTPISAEHLEVRKLTDLPGLQQLAAADPLALLRLALASHNHALSADRLETVLTPAIIPAADWKKWWDATKRQAKKDPHFDIPAKKTEPITLRAAPVSQQDELLETFHDAPSLGQKTETARQFLKIVDQIADPELLLQEFQDGLLAALNATKPELLVQRLEAAFLLEDLRAHQKTPTDGEATLVTGILSQAKNLPAFLDDLNAASQKRALTALKTAQPDRLLACLNQLPLKAFDQIADLIATDLPQLNRLVQNQTASAELLCWLGKNVTSNDWLQPFQGSGLVRAMFTALENAPAKSAAKLYDLLLNDDSLLVDLLANASTDAVRDIARQLLATPAFEELDRRSLMARLVKVFPFVQEFLVTRTTKEQPLIVSWASYRRRQAELEDIIQKKIPANSKEIGVARSYGDLRENFEFKAAKDMQKILMRRRGELELLLARAQATDFTDAKPEVAGIGTSVTVTDIATGQPSAYHILGAWDSDPARGIISYPAALAQALFNKRSGDVVEVAGDTGTVKLRIERVEKVPAEILQSL